MLPESGEHQECRLGSDPMINKNPALCKNYLRQTGSAQLSGPAEVEMDGADAIMITMH